MKRIVLCVILLSAGLLWAGNVSLTKVAEWGSGHYYYYDAFLENNYAYCAIGEAGVDILDISSPEKPSLVSHFDTPGDARDIYVSGKYAYIADYREGLLIYDISNPSVPVKIGNYKIPRGYGLYKVVVSGNYAYCNGFLAIDISDPTAPFLAGSFGEKGWDGDDFVIIGQYAVLLQSYYTPGRQGNQEKVKYENRDTVNGSVDGRLSILDISNPADIKEVGRFEQYDLWVESISVAGDYAYVMALDLMVFDISDPRKPTLKNTFPDISGRRIRVEGNTALLLTDDYPNSFLLALDVTNPVNPKVLSTYTFPGQAHNISVAGNMAYTTHGKNGLKVLDVSDPTDISFKGSYNNSRQSYIAKVCVHGNYAYTVGEYLGFGVFNISNPAKPVLVGNCDISPKRNPSSHSFYHLIVSGKYAYAAAGNTIYIIDVSNPKAPLSVSSFTGQGKILGMSVNGNYAYLSENFKRFTVLDMSNPANLKEVGHIEMEMYLGRVITKGNYAYVMATWRGLIVIDISDPTQPALVSTIKEIYANDPACLSGNYIYAEGYGSSEFPSSYVIQVIDISDPANPVLASAVEQAGLLMDITVNGSYLYLAHNYQGIRVLDAADPGSPRYVASYNTQGWLYGLSVNGDHIFGANEKLVVLKQDNNSGTPKISLNPVSIEFSGDYPGTLTGSQRFEIKNSGGGTLNWSATADKNWLTCSPQSGIDTGAVWVSVDPRKLFTGTHTGAITVTGPYAQNSPQTVTVTLTVRTNPNSEYPFGEFDKPSEGSSARGSVAVTGWALDNMGIAGVQIFREDETNNSLVFIGDAVFVEGARPDVAARFPNYPDNTRAGWGYMLLTNFLPGGGNGTFVLHALATDLEGNQVTLGKKTIYCDNANAVNPFGNIETPEQGGIASGQDFVVWGWALTPQPNTIPVDGSTIDVWVDGVKLGHPVYNIYREDIAVLFPGYTNSGGAVGYSFLDTTAYEDGVHVIYWTAADNAGNTDGIGSRYFTIQNNNSRQMAAVGENNFSPERLPPDLFTPVGVKRGYREDAKIQTVYPDAGGIVTIRINPMQRLEIRFGAKVENLTPLPIGATLDRNDNALVWQTGPGFLGLHRLVFRVKTTAQGWQRKEITVYISARE